MGYCYLQEVILGTSVDPTNLLYLLPVNNTAITVINTGYGIFIITLVVNLLSILSFVLDQRICFDYRPYTSNKRLIL